MSVMFPSWAQGRLFLTVLINVAQSAPSASCPLSVPVPEMGITVGEVPRIDTGGERRLISRGGFTWGFELSGWV